MKDLAAFLLLILMMLEQCSHSRMVDEKNKTIAKLFAEIQRCERGKK